MSIYEKKGRVRKPRVHITYEVETGGSMVMKELPFVVGAMADLQGDTAPDKKLKDTARTFKEIDRDNFDDVLAGYKPTLNFRVDNRLKNDGSELSVGLEFNSMKDFSPDSIVQQVGPLKDLLDVRNKLKDLLNRSEANDRLEDVLNEILKNEDLRGKLQGAFGSDGGGESPADADAAEGDGAGDSPENTDSEGS